MALKYVQANTLYLSGSGVVVGATSISLTSFADIYGNVLTMTDFGAKGYITLEPDTTNEESATFTGVTANANGTYTLTGVQTALGKSPYTETSGLVRNHAGGTKIVITDNVEFWNTFANKTNDEIITGNWTFINAPASLSATPASTTQLGNVKLTVAPSRSLGTATITIASPAVVSVTAHGLIAGDTVQFSTTGALPTGLATNTTYFVIAAGLTTNAFEVSLTAGGTAVNTSGSQSGVHTALKVTPVAVTANDPSIFPNAYAVDTGAANAYVITLATAPSALVAGQMYAFLAGTANTTSSTLNINGLGAKAILRSAGTALQAGDIGTSQTIVVIYDGTSFRIDGAASSSGKFGGTGSDGVLNVTSGTTTINLGNAAVVVKNYTSINISNGATVNFSNPNTNGTVVILKSQGAVTILGTLDDSGMGAAGVAGISASGGNPGNAGNAGLSYSAVISSPSGAAAAQPTAAGAVGAVPTLLINNAFYSTITNTSFLKYAHLVTSSSGGSGASRFNSVAGSGTTGSGGTAGGTLLIECGGAWNFQGTISVAGLNGGNATVSGGQQASGGGGGGGGGFFMALYNSLTANSGTVTITGGTGGTSTFTTNTSAAPGGSGGASFANAGSIGTLVTSGQGGGNGGGGVSLIMANNDFT